MAICIHFHHSTLFKVILNVTPLIDMSFFSTSNNVIFGLSLPFFFWFPQQSTHYFLLLH